MNLFAGLYSYEVVLMLLGIALFIALLVALLRNVFKDKPFAALIPALFIPIVMIGYPSIESVQYQNGIVEINKAVDQVQSDPSNQQAKEQLKALEVKVNKLAPRAVNDPNARNILAKANLALKGQPAKNAKSESRDEGKTTSETSQTAGLIKEAEEYTKTLSSSPGNKEANVRLTAVIRKLKAMGATDPTSEAAIERGEKALGHSVN